MAPATQSSPISGVSSINSRLPTMRTVRTTATLQSSTMGTRKSSLPSSSTIRHTDAALSSSVVKQSSTSVSTSRSTQPPVSSTTKILTTTRQSTARTTTHVHTSSTHKSTASGPPTSQSVSSALVSSTTPMAPVVTGHSPDGTHPIVPTSLPPMNQGQHGTTPAGDAGANTTVIITGVLIPLILVGVGALIFYIWYRRKYPVRMVLGRDFSRFSNPAYNSRASTVTLLREDAEKEWERINTLSRRNPDLSMVDEEQPDGIVNRAFESEHEEFNGGIIVEKSVDVEVEKYEHTTEETENHKEKSTNVGISRERPKTKKAVLVKADTVEDLENGFELVTESDLGVRTESEVSSGNESTETHTISLSFSDTFDDRYKDGKTNEADKGKHNDNTNDLQSVNEPDKNICLTDETRMPNDTLCTNGTIEKEADIDSIEPFKDHKLELNESNEQVEHAFDSNKTPQQMDKNGNDKNEICSSNGTGSLQSIADNDPCVKDTRENETESINPESPTDNKFESNGSNDEMQYDIDAGTNNENELGKGREFDSDKSIIANGIGTASISSGWNTHNDNQQSMISDVTNVEESTEVKNSVMLEYASNIETESMSASDDTVKQSIQSNYGQQSDKSVGSVGQSDSFVIVPKNIDQRDLSLSEEVQSYNEGQFDEKMVEENMLNLTKEDSSFELLSDPEDTITNRAQLGHDANESVLQNDTNILEKEKIEISEKESPTKFEFQNITSDELSNQITDNPLLVETSNASKEKESEKSSVENEPQRKRPFLDLSNENIVLETVPQTPTVFVQESFILETEATHPVHLDDVITSPTRGRRAFTLNDIASNPSFEFSLPKGKDDISKSSPVISELKTPDFPTFDRKHLDHSSIARIVKEKRQFFSDDSLNGSSIQSNDNKNDETHLFPEMNENKENAMPDLLNKADAPNVHVLKNSTAAALSITDSLSKNCNLEDLESQTDSADMNFLESDTENSKKSDFEMSTGNTPLGSFNMSTDSFDIISTDLNKSEELYGPSHQLTENSDEDGKLCNDVRERSSTDDKSDANTEVSSQLFSSNNKHDIVGFIESATEDDSFFEDFPKASTPTASFVNDRDKDHNEVSQRKTVVAQTFDFENSSISENDSSTSEESSESEDGKIFEEYVASHSTFESEVLGLEKHGKKSVDGFDQAHIEEPKPSTNYTLTGSDSPLSLSFDMLSGESRQDSSKEGREDCKIESQDELLFTINTNEKNPDTNVVLADSSGNTNMLDFISGVPKQTSIVNTSADHTGTSDISWEVVAENVDNSEC